MESSSRHCETSGASVARALACSNSISQRFRAASMCWLKTFSFTLSHFLHQQNCSLPLTIKVQEGVASDPAFDRLAAAVGRIERYHLGIGAIHHAGTDGSCQLLDRQPKVQLQQRLVFDLLGAQAPHILGPAVPDKDVEVGVRNDHCCKHAGKNGLE